MTGTGRIMHATTDNTDMKKSPTACCDGDNIHNQRNVSHPPPTFPFVPVLGRETGLKSAVWLSANLGMSKRPFLVQKRGEKA